MDWRALLALGLYGLLSFALFGRTLIGNFDRLHLGRTTDTSLFMWALVWWPYALKQGLNPFICKLVWPPVGFDLAWFTGVPLASLLLAPLTSAYGPAVSYNVLCLSTPALAAWSAFLLCRYFCRNIAAALVGGYVFGFSPYVLGRLSAGHPVLLLVFPLPLIALTVASRLHKNITCARFVFGLASLIVAQFLFSTEVVATAAIFGGTTLGLSWIFSNDPERRKLSKLVAPLATAAAAGALILMPYLYYLLRDSLPHGAIRAHSVNSANLLDFVFPPGTVATARFATFDTFFSFGPRPLAGCGKTRPDTASTKSRPQCGHDTAPWINVFTSQKGFFRNLLGGGDAYFGIPLLAVIALYARAERRTPVGRTLLATLGIVCTLALGPRLHIGNATAFGMPWKLFTHLPLIKNALPGRFVNYAFLVAAVIVALWLADERVSLRLCVGLAILLIAAGFPSLDPQVWTRPVDLPAFFSSGTYRRYLRPGEVVIALPYGSIGNTMLWQAATGMYFRMAVGYTGLHPRDFDEWPIINAFANTTMIPEASLQLKVFMAAHDVTAIVADDSQIAQWGGLLTTIDPSPLHTGGITLYRIAATDLARYGGLTAAAMARRDEEARFTALVAAARNYLIAGRPLAALSPMEAQRLGLLPPGSVDDPDVRTNAGLYLGPWQNQQIAIGVVGSYATLQPLIDQYRSRAKAVFFPFPKDLKDAPRGDTFLRLLVMVFDRSTLIDSTPRDQPAAAARPPSD